LRLAIAFRARHDASDMGIADVSLPRLRRRIVEAGLSGAIFPPGDDSLLELFKGSVDRFALIAWRLRGHHRVLDCGAGRGMLCAILKYLGHDVHAVDLPYKNDLILLHGIPFQHVNLEHDPLPFPDASFDAVTCCQVMEHFVHSHLPAAREFHRVLRPGGLCEIDVPNAASLRNRSRLLRGKNITWDYEKHYLLAEPTVYKGREFYPDRHNREFTADELRVLLRHAGFGRIEVFPIASRRHRQGLDLVRSAGSMMRDLVPGWRKTLMAIAVR
jgi:SAM-dependent methyltransferase